MWDALPAPSQSPPTMWVLELHSALVAARLQGEAGRGGSQQLDSNAEGEGHHPL